MASLANLDNQLISYSGTNWHFIINNTIPSWPKKYDGIVNNHKNVGPEFFWGTLCKVIPLHTTIRVLGYQTYINSPYNRVSWWASQLVSRWASQRASLQESRWTSPQVSQRVLCISKQMFFFSTLLGSTFTSDASVKWLYKLIVHKKGSIRRIRKYFKK